MSVRGIAAAAGGNGRTMGPLAIGAAGALLAVVAAADLLVTVFNYDGFEFVAGRFQRLLWRLLRTLSRPLPRTPRHAFLSLGSAAMLPATVALWLGLEVTGFAMVYLPGLGGRGFRLTGAGRGIGTGFYLSAGAISSLTFGDVTPRAGLDRALVDLETIVGLTTFTLALGYVVTAFGVLGRLDRLHATVRRHAEDPGRPSSVLARHFRGGDPSELPGLLQSLTDDLESYDEGLRRYPVVYFFHTRRVERSIPRVFGALGDLVALLRYGLPSNEPVTRDPYLAALEDEYDTTVRRLLRSFVGPYPLELPEPLPEPAFLAAYRGEAEDAGVAGFRRLEEHARECTGIELPPGPAEAYARYRDWLPFAHRRRVLLARIADALGYDRPELVTSLG